MRSALLITLEYPPQIGGIAVYLSRLAECFPTGGIQVLASAAQDTHKTDMRSPVPIYRRRLLWRWFKPSWLPTLYWADWICRKEGNPSVVIVSHLLPMGEAAYWLNRLRRVPYCVILHGMDAALALSSGGRKRRNAVRILSRAAVVAANSEHTARLAEALGVPKDKIVIVRPSPDFPLYITVPPEKSAFMRERFGFRAEDIVVLSVGRLVARKGFDTAIRAVAALKAKGPAVKLLIVGDGPEKGNLEKLVGELGVAESVRFAGALNDEDLPVCYATSDIFVMVPRSIGADVEGFGIVYLEAALFGKPAVGSRSGGVPEAVLHEKTGLLVEPGDVEQTAAAIGRLAADPALRETLGQEARQRVVDQFGWSRQAQGLIAALDEVIGEKQL